MSEPFIGEIRMMGFNFNPRSWAKCDGQLLAISSNEALFSLLGTTYGGDGRTTFGLPDLRSRVPVHQGRGPGLSNRPLGQKWGEESTTLSVANMPNHSHGLVCNNANGEEKAPVNGFLAVSSEDDEVFAASGNANMNAGAIQASGGGQPFNNMSPYLTVNFCIALEGLYPSRS